MKRAEDITALSFPLPLTTTVLQVTALPQHRCQRNDDAPPRRARP
jgi:hypothetical protein